VFDLIKQIEDKLRQSKLLKDCEYIVLQLFSDGCLAIYYKRMTTRGIIDFHVINYENVAQFYTKAKEYLDA
jgi:hypothetical protein